MNMEEDKDDNSFTTDFCDFEETSNSSNSSDDDENYCNHEYCNFIVNEASLLQFLKIYGEHCIRCQQ
jgi:hypothetical protein